MAHSRRRLLNAPSPMITGASLEPMPSSRQLSHLGVFCSSRSILGIAGISLGLFGSFAIEKFESASIAAFAHLFQRVDPIVGKDAIEFGLGLVDKRAQLQDLFRVDQALGAVARCVI